MRNVKPRCGDCESFKAGVCKNQLSKWYLRILSEKTVGCPEFSVGDRGKYIISSDPVKGGAPEVFIADRETGEALHVRYLKQYPLLKKECFAPKKSIRKRSPSKQKKKNMIASIKVSLIRDFGKICMLDGRSCENPDAFHIFSIGKYPMYETEPWNIILSRPCYNAPLWDQGLWEDIRQMPGFHMIMKIIWDKDHDPNKLHTENFYHILMERENK